jgi:hypothetical protein
VISKNGFSKLHRGVVPLPLSLSLSRFFFPQKESLSHLLGETGVLLPSHPLSLASYHLFPLGFSMPTRLLCEASNSVPPHLRHPLFMAQPLRDEVTSQWGMRSTLTPLRAVDMLIALVQTTHTEDVYDTQGSLFFVPLHTTINLPNLNNHHQQLTTPNQLTHFIQLPVPSHYFFFLPFFFLPFFFLPKAVYGAAPVQSDLRWLWRSDLTSFDGTSATTPTRRS